MILIIPFNFRIPIKVEGSSDPSPRPTSSQQIPQAPPPPPSAATKTSAPAAGQAQKPQEPLHEDPTMAKVLKIGQLADDLGQFYIPRVFSRSPTKNVISV